MMFGKLGINPCAFLVLEIVLFLVLNFVLTIVLFLVLKIVLMIVLFLVLNFVLMIVLFLVLEIVLMIVLFLVLNFVLLIVLFLVLNFVLMIVIPGFFDAQPAFAKLWPVLLLDRPRSRAPQTTESETARVCKACGPRLLLYRPRSPRPKLRSLNLQPHLRTQTGLP